MSKPFTFPTLYDEVHSLSITKLKEWGYLKPHQKVTNASITWSRNENKTSSMTIHTDTNLEDGSITFDYKYKGEPRKYNVDLVSIPSNLGTGLIWYFVCPRTNKRCRKLFLIDGHLLHREAFNGCMYECQTLSKNNRALCKMLEPYFKSDNLYSELYSKNFKKTYAGKPTKKYLKIMEQIQKAESIPYHEIERAMIS
jgi:hypothetical protein